MLLRIPDPSVIGFGFVKLYELYARRGGGPSRYLMPAAVAKKPAKLLILKPTIGRQNAPLGSFLPSRGQESSNVADPKTAYGATKCINWAVCAEQEPKN